MLYQFMDEPVNSSIHSIIKKRASVVESIVVFMSDFSVQMYINALNIGYKPGTFTFVNLLGTNHNLSSDTFTLEDLISSKKNFKLIKKEKTTAYYINTSNIVVKVKLNGEEVNSVTYSYPDYVITDYYLGKLVYSKKKNKNSDDIEIIFYDNNGEIFYTSPKENIYLYKGYRYNSKSAFYDKLLSEYSFTKEDILSIDWCEGFQSIICKNKQESKVVVPLYCEIFNTSSLYPRTEIFNNTSIAGELAYYAKQFKKKKDPHFDLKGTFRFISNFENKIDAIYPQTKKMKQIIEKHIEAGFIPDMEVKVYKMIDRKITPNRSKGNKKICSVSRISVEKRIDWIIKAVFFAHKIDPEITLDIYGRGSEYDELITKELVKYLKAEEYITFKGWLNEKTDIADYSVFMNTSITEGYPLTILEATSCGCPIVGTDIVGHSELTKDFSLLVNLDGKTENEICYDLSLRIIEAINRYDELSRNALQFAIENFNKDITDNNIKLLFSL